METVIDVVVKDNTGGQGGGAKEENPKSDHHCGKPCQEQLGGGFKMDHEQGEIQHHGPELCGTEGGQGGGTSKQIPKSDPHCGKPCQEQLGGGFKIAILGKPLPERVQMAGYQVGMVLVLSIMVFALYNDVSKF